MDISAFCLLPVLIFTTGSVGYIDPCMRPIICTNGTRMANHENCSRYYECSHASMESSVRWIVRQCSKDTTYDYKEEVCLNSSQAICHERCPVDLNLNTRESLTDGTRSQTFKEDSRVQLNCCFRHKFNSINVTIPKFLWRRNGREMDSNGQRYAIADGKDYDEFNSINSTLTFDHVLPFDAGLIQCIVYYKVDLSHNNISGEFQMNVLERPRVSINPLSVDVFKNQSSFNIYCILINSNITNGVIFTWYKDGHVILQKTVTYSRQSRLEVLYCDHDLKVGCVAETIGGISILETSVVTILRYTDQVCPHNESNSMKWTLTRMGNTNLQPCPGNSTGVCSRACVNRFGSSVWSEPNCGGCVSKLFGDLLTELKQVNTGGGNLEKIAKELSNATAGGLLFGDLNASVTIIGKSADLRNRKENINSSEIKDVLRAISNCLQPNNKDSWITIKETNDTAAAQLMKSADVYGRHLTKEMGESNSTRLNQSYIKLEAAAISVGTTVQSLNFSFESEDKNMDFVLFSTDSVDSETLKNGTTLKLWSIYYLNINGYLRNQTKNNPNFSVASRIQSLTIDGLTAERKLKRPVTIKLHHSTTELRRPRKCVYWDFSAAGGGDWNHDGCNVTTWSADYTVCHCDHLTNFAILMSSEAQTSFVLSIISTVGCSVSVISLVLTIIIYAATWKQSKSDQAVMLMNLCVALVIANVIFLAGADQVTEKSTDSTDGTATEQQILCKVIAVFLHYSFLVAFFVMLAEGVQLLLFTVFVFHARVRRRNETQILIVAAWVLPAVVVAISLAVTKTDGYGSEKSCWLDVENNLIWAFVGPVLCIIAANAIILIVVLSRISTGRLPSNRTNVKKSKIRSSLWSIAVICPLLGSTWVLGIFTISFNQQVFQYLFACVNSLQGLFIFLFQVVFNSKKKGGKLRILYSQYLSRSKKRKPAAVQKTVKPPNITPEAERDAAGNLVRKGSIVDRQDQKGAVSGLIKYFEQLQSDPPAAISRTSKATMNQSESEFCTNPLSLESETTMTSVTAEIHSNTFDQDDSLPSENRQ